MLEKKDIDQLRQVFRRIFSLPVTRSSFKEIQRSIFTAVGEDKNKANEVLDALLNGEQDKSSSSNFQELIEEFGVRTRLAREVLERGEFINFLSSDLINPGQHILFVNFIRRIDGQEFQFLTEPEGIVYLLKHFLGRIEEIQRIDKSKEFIKNQANDLKELKDKLDKLISSVYTQVS